MPSPPNPLPSSLLLLLPLLIPLIHAQQQQQPSNPSPTCRQLPADTCAATCVPFNAGLPSQADFSCADWWLDARCCNGSLTQTLVTTLYYECFCQTLGMTAKGLGTILALALISVAVLIVAIFYVLYRKKQTVQAQEEERDKAMEEAQLYLPR